MKGKILAVFMIVVLAACVCSVSAFELHDETAFDENQTVEIDGIEFNVPKGYCPDVSDDAVVKFESAFGKDFVADGKMYHRGLTAVLVNVDESSNATGENATIAGVDGLLNHEGKFFTFSYLKDGKMLVITTNDRNAIGDFIKR